MIQRTFLCAHIIIVKKFQGPLPDGVTDTEGWEKEAKHHKHGKCEKVSRQIQI